MCMNEETQIFAIKKLFFKIMRYKSICTWPWNKIYILDEMQLYVFEKRGYWVYKQWNENEKNRYSKEPDIHGLENHIDMV